MENRRKYHRIPAHLEACTVRVDNVELKGSIVDESISGAGITGLDLLVMPYNKPLSVKYRDESFEANARHIGRQPDGQFNLGVIRRTELKPEDTADSPAMLINCYVQHGDAYVICMPIIIESDSQVLIQLWDGVQFRVPRSQLSPKSRLERYAMLDDLGCLQYTTEMYGLKSVSPEIDRKQLFEYEFGQYAHCPVLSQNQQLVSR